LKHGKSEKESEQSDDFKTRALQLWEEKKRRALQEVRLSKKKQQTEAIEITPTKTSEQSHGSVDVDALFNMLSQGKDVIRRSDWDAAFAKATGNCEAENGHALPSTVVEIQGRSSGILYCAKLKYHQGRLNTQIVQLQIKWVRHSQA